MMKRSLSSRWSFRWLVMLAGCAMFMSTAACEGSPEKGQKESGSPKAAKESSPPKAEPAEKEGAKTMEFKLTSTAFEEGVTIPKKYTGDGPDVSPPLKWTDPPAGTKTFALICDDPDAPMGTWVHWVLFNIPEAVRELPEGVKKDDTLPDGSVQGMTDFRKVGYGGPAPPPGPVHRYYFKLYALDAPLSLAPRSNKKAVEDAMKGHILGRAQLMGRYKR